MLNFVRIEPRVSSRGSRTATKATIDSFRFLIGGQGLVDLVGLSRGIWYVFSIKKKRKKKTKQTERDDKLFSLPTWVFLFGEGRATRARVF